MRKVQPWDYLDDVGLTTHASVYEEISFLTAVANGDVNVVKEKCRQAKFSELDGLGVLSRNPVLNQKYHFIITIALIARMCVTRGMSMDQAFTRSDHYIRLLDDLSSVEEINLLHDQMSLDYTTRMLELKEHVEDKSLLVVNCVNYCLLHITENISVKDIADNIGVSVSHLSRQFSKEMGCSLSDFIRDHKLELSLNYLKYSEYSLIEIANRLSFSSQSHFIQKFRERYGITPSRYREEYFRSDWGGLHPGDDRKFNL